MSSPPPMQNTGTPNPYFGQATTSPAPHQQSYPPHERQYSGGNAYPERSYTLGGDGYGSNTVPPLPEHQRSNPTPPGGYYGGYAGDESRGGPNPYGAPLGYEPHAHSQSPPLPQSYAQPMPINTNMASGYGSQPQSAHAGTAPTSPVKGPRSQPSLRVVGDSPPEDSPPGYEPSASGVTGNWGKR